jgi:hypothetical protein
VGFCEGIFEVPDAVSQLVYFFVEDFCIGEDETDDRTSFEGRESGKV